jgi:hypothetical protein
MKLLVLLALLLTLDACQNPRRLPPQIEPLAEAASYQRGERTPPLGAQRVTQRENPSTGSPTTSTPSAVLTQLRAGSFSQPTKIGLKIGKGLPRVNLL